MIPTLSGVHHLKLPVSDLTRSIDWYRTRLGYTVGVEFTEQGVLRGVALHHSNGGPMLGLRLDPERAAATAGFDFFSIGVPDRAALEALAGHLTGLGESHAGVHRASLGWILPQLHDPDGHEVRFYTEESHTELGEDPLTIDNPRETAAAREREEAR
ncbi:VOC family protein [Nocardia concava]|uniref:VOC family protein n=1 Tax=Nocardia concava TaxID=257281 RepID=UPI000314BBA3|nr:VOC family protein [Nocardia concava]